jgi:arylsulfatase A-like enzyme
MDWPTALRAPRLCLGVGLIAGAAEFVTLALTARLPAEINGAVGLALCSVSLGGAAGALMGLVLGPLIGALARRAFAPARSAAAMTLCAGAFAAFYALPAALDHHRAGALALATLIALSPVGAIGLVWTNAHYWLRREEMTEGGFRVGWTALSIFLTNLICLGGVAALVPAFSAPGMDDRKSVVVITVDTLRRDHVSVYGDSPVNTSYMDVLALRGLVARDAVSPLPETAPAHAALWTGRHPVRTGVLSNGHRLSEGYQTLAEQLQSEGYATGAFVSAYALDSHTGLAQGFEVYDDDFAPGPPGLTELKLVRLGLRLMLRFGDPADHGELFERSARETSDRAIRWMEGHVHEPFLLWVHFFEPHAPYQPHGISGFEDNGPPEAPALDHRPILAEEPGRSYTSEEQERLRRLYAEEVARVDQEIGRLMRELNRRLGTRPPIYVVLADHGESLGEQGVNFTHQGIGEAVIRIPLYFAGPGFQPGSIGEQVRIMDVPATILGALGTSALPQAEGKDLRGFVDGSLKQDLATLLLGRRPGNSDFILGYRAGKAEGEGTMKFLYDPRSGAAQLYDLAADPGETTDISSKVPEEVARLVARMKEEAGNLDQQARPDHIDPVTQAALEALGYQEPE